MITALPRKTLEITPARNSQMCFKVNNSLFGLQNLRYFYKVIFSETIRKCRYAEEKFISANLCKGR